MTEPTASARTTAAILPLGPVDITFHAADGQTLSGRYYPAMENPAPLLILLHWAKGDQDDWNAIARWLQNRGMETEPTTGRPWTDTGWFPALPKGFGPIGVFTFTFRGCEGGCKEFNREGWKLDAQAAFETAFQMEGVDPLQVAAAGASIGADGAALGCAWLNLEAATLCYDRCGKPSPTAKLPCRGALSFSPGGYLTAAYAEEARALVKESPPSAAWCVYAPGDGPANDACKSLEAPAFKAVEFTGSAHGMDLIRPGDSGEKALLMLAEFVTKTVSR